MVEFVGGYILKEDYKTKAKRLAIPLDIVKMLPQKTLYLIEKTPEIIEKYWELAIFIKYIREKYELTKENFSSFIFSSKNITQKDRELLVVWFFARFIAGLHGQTLHFSLALPKQDKGIDCYIRIIDFKNKKLAALPIQVCDVPIQTAILRKSKIEEIIFSTSLKAKSKPIDCKGSILLLHLLGSGENGVVTIDRFKLRDLFEKQKWPYRKIIFQIDTQLRNEFITLYCENKNEYFRGVRENKKSKIILGRTVEDEIKCGALSRKQSKIEFYI